MRWNGSDEDAILCHVIFGFQIYNTQIGMHSKHNIPKPRGNVNINSKLKISHK